VVWFGRVWEGQGWSLKEGVPERRKTATDHGQRGEWASGSLLGSLIQWAGQQGKIRKPKKDKISWASLGGGRSFKVWTQSMVSAFEVGVRQKPRKVTACKQSWALAGETRYPLEARKLRRLAVPFSESCWKGEHRRRSLTYCRSVLGFVLHMTRIQARA
jgi:hypothetical protein